MAHRQQTTKYGNARGDEAVQELEFSLEDILAEYGSSREQKLREAVEQEAAIAENAPSVWQERETAAEEPALQIPEPEPVSSEESLPDETGVPEELPAPEEKPGWQVFQTVKMKMSSSLRL